jgi:hypothetical protein
MKTEKSIPSKGVVLRENDLHLDQKVFRYEMTREVDVSVVAAATVSDAETADFPEEALASLSVDSDAYCDWIDSLSGD